MRYAADLEHMVCEEGEENIILLNPKKNCERHVKAEEGLKFEPFVRGMLHNLPYARFLSPIDSAEVYVPEGAILEYRGKDHILRTRPIPELSEMKIELIDTTSGNFATPQYNEIMIYQGRENMIRRISRYLRKL